jgi:hypothetical protein
MPPVFQVIYTTSHQNHAIRHETDWVCPTGFTPDESRQAFQQRYPSTAVVQFRSCR